MSMACPSGGGLRWTQLLTPAARAGDRRLFGEVRGLGVLPERYETESSGIGYRRRSWRSTSAATSFMPRASVAMTTWAIGRSSRTSASVG